MVITSETVSIASPVGTPYELRYLSPGSDLKPYNVYSIVKPITVQAGEVAPWFGHPGGGIQYEFSQTVAELIEAGFLRRVIE